MRAGIPDNIGIAAERAATRAEFERLKRNRGHTPPPAPAIIAAPVRAPAAPPIITTGAARVIIEAVAVAFNVSIYAIISTRGGKPDVAARFAAYKLIRERLKMSTPRIARATGRKDHHAILTGIDRADQWLATDPEWATRYRAAEHALDGRR